MPTNTYDESGRKLRECAETWTHDVAFWKSATGGSYHPTNCPCNGTGFVRECRSKECQCGMWPDGEPCAYCSGSGWIGGVPAFNLISIAGKWWGWTYCGTGMSTGSTHGVSERWNRDQAVAAALEALK